MFSAASGTPSYIMMNSSFVTSTAVDLSLLDRPEYQQFFTAYQYYELRGMKMEVTVGQFNSTGNKIVHGVTMYGGPAAGVPSGGTVPDPERSAGLPLVKACNLQGQMTSGYVDVTKGLRNAGLPLSMQRTNAYPAEWSYCLFLIMTQEGFNANDHIGQVVCTWYVRMHQRKYVA